MRPRLLFLPGAVGAEAFWHPVGELLPERWGKVFLSWPGLGAEPPRSDVNGFDDLVRLVERELRQSSVLVAQSVGGVVAVQVARRNPRAVSRLVLVATSAGVDVARLGATNWRTTYRANHPRAAGWITSEQLPDQTGEIPLIEQPTLLLWGDSDPVSPTAVGEHLHSLLPGAQLHVISGGGHDLAVTHASLVAPLIEAHAR